MKKNPQYYNRLFLGLLALSILFLLAGAATANTGLLGTGLALSFGSFVFRCMTYRCPHCGYYLGRRSAAHCPRCKKDIE